MSVEARSATSDALQANFAVIISISAPTISSSLGAAADSSVSSASKPDEMLVAARSIRACAAAKPLVAAEIPEIAIYIEVSAQAICGDVAGVTYSLERIVPTLMLYMVIEHFRNGDAK